VLFSSNFLALLSGLFSNLAAIFFLVIFLFLFLLALLELVLSRREMRLKIEFFEFSGIFSCFVWLRFSGIWYLVVQHMDPFVYFQNTQ